MDNKLYFLAVEAGYYIELERLKREKMRIEAEPEPVFNEAGLFNEFLKTETKALEDELQQTITNIVSTAGQEILATYSPERLIEQTKQVCRKNVASLAPSYLMLKCLPLLKASLEKDMQSRAYGKWASRTNEIDRQLQEWKRKEPKHFTPSMINLETMNALIPGNKELRFPIDRIGVAGNAYFCKWLTDYLDTKPVLFEPHERYVESLIRCYNEVYLVEHRREEKQKQTTIAEQEAANKALVLEKMKNFVPQKDLHSPEGMWGHPDDSALWQGERR
jgi:hypothetical protein